MAEYINDNVNRQALRFFHYFHIFAKKADIGLPFITFSLIIYTLIFTAVNTFNM